MAGTAGLNRPERRRLLAVVVVVLLAHVAALLAFSHWQAETRLLKPMVAPMYTRLLQPAPPPEPPPVVAQAAPAPPPKPTVQIRPTPSVPAKNTPTRRKPQPEPQPKPVPEPPVAEREAPEAVPPTEAEGEPETPPDTVVAQAPEPPASAPGEAAAPAPAHATPPTPPASTPGAGADPTASPADSWPADTRLRYRLGGRFRSGDLYGDARVLWQREGSRYQVRVEVTLTFLAEVTLTSQGQLDAATLRPQVYEEVRNGRPRGVRMDEREVTLSSGSVVPRPPGMQDTASQFVELSHRFATGREKLEVGRSVSFWMARLGGIDLWTYDVVGTEMLRTGMGEVQAFHLKPRPIANPRGNITAEMWFAPSLQYLPVRIRVNMGEEAHLDLMVEAIEQR